MQNNREQIIDWLDLAMETAEVHSEMTPYAPLVYFTMPIDLSDNSIPKEILERAKARLYGEQE